MINALTIDVEDYYSVFARDRLGVEYPPSDAVVRNTARVLDRLGENIARATFFILGEVAAAFPQLLRDIAADGHEIGLHGFYHRQIFKLSPDQFYREISDAKKLIEDIIGRAVKGHRAPAFSIRPDTQWALEVLAKAEFKYDSSIFPVAGKRYGWLGFPLDIHEMTLPNGTTIIEAPLSTIRIFGKTIPACGGGYFRHFPYWFTCWAMRRVRRRRPTIVYLHPYEIDTDPPPPAFEKALVSADKTVRKFHAMQLRNRRTVEVKFARLLKDFRFAPLGEVISAALGDSTQ